MESKVYQKGQIVIPANLRKQYGIEIGGTVKIIPEKNCLKLIPQNKKESILNIAGCFKSSLSFPSKKDIEDAAQKGYKEDFEK